MEGLKTLYSQLDKYVEDSYANEVERVHRDFVLSEEAKEAWAKKVTEKLSKEAKAGNRECKIVFLSGSRLGYLIPDGFQSWNEAYWNRLETVQSTKARAALEQSVNDCVNNTLSSLLLYWQSLDTGGVTVTLVDNPYHVGMLFEWPSKRQKSQ